MEEHGRFIFFFGEKKFIGSATTTDERELDLRVRRKTDKKYESDPLEVIYLDAAVPNKKEEPDPWWCFDKYATFADILAGVVRDPIRDPQSMIRFIKEIRKGTIAGVGFLKNRKQFLETIRDYPVILAGQDVALRFIEIVQEARYGSKKSREAHCHLLEEYFLPKWKKDPDPVSRIDIARLLMKRLAKPLSDGIKSQIGAEGEWRAVREMSPADWEKRLKEIKPDLDPRLKKLPPEDIREMVIHPKSYAEQLLMQHLGGITSRETLRKKMSKE